MHAGMYSLRVWGGLRFFGFWGVSGALLAVTRMAATAGRKPLGLAGFLPSNLEGPSGNEARFTEGLTLVYSHETARRGDSPKIKS